MIYKYVLVGQSLEYKISKSLWAVECKYRLAERYTSNTKIVVAPFCAFNCEDKCWLACIFMGVGTIKLNAVRRPLAERELYHVQLRQIITAQQQTLFAVSRLEVADLYEYRHCEGHRTVDFSVNKFLVAVRPESVV